MKKTVLLICGMIAMAFGMEANAQKPYNMDDLYEIGKLSKGSISDFVSWMLAEPEDELNGPMSEAWQLYRKNKPLGKGTTIILDEKNGYFRYEIDYDKEYEDEEGKPVESITVVEMCVWNCADGKHKLFAENVGGTYQGKPHNDGQYDGTVFFLYDKATQKLYGCNEAIDSEELSGLAPQQWRSDGEHYFATDHVTGEWKQMTNEEFDKWMEDRPVVTLSLPRSGKDIKAHIYTPTGNKERTFAWDGYRFHLSK